MENPRASGPDRAPMLDGIESNHKSIMEAFVARKIDAVAAGGDWDGKRRSSMSPPPPSVVWRRRHRSSESDASSIASSALSIAPPSILSISPPPTATLSPTFTISSHEQHGWATPKMRARGMSIASLEVPTTPTSIGESAKHQSIMSKHQSIMKPLPPLPPQQQPSGFGEITIPHRPKRRKHRQSWDSGYRSQMSGPHTRGNSVDEGTAAWPSIHRQQQLLRDREAMPPPAPPSEQQQEQQPQRQSAPSVNPDALNILESSAPAPSSPVSSSDSEDEDEGIDLDEASSDTTTPAEDAAGRVLNYALDVALGLGTHEIDDDPTCRTVVHNFFSDLQWAVKKSQQQQQNDSDQPSRTVSSASNGSRGSRRSTGRSKRKSREGTDGDGGEDGTEEGGGGGGSKQREPGPAKRAKLESPVRMSCPFRKKNPLRFNVRDHRLCALTVFTDTAELRRHIQDCHKRPNNLPQHRCPRCQTQFSTATNLREHLLFRDNVLCDIVDATTAADAEAVYTSGGGGDRNSTGSSLSSNYQMRVDPEDGIDPATAEKLRSKKGRVSDSIEVQWLKIWELLFPDTEVQPYDYVAVIEHHELHAKYRESLPVLRGSLSAIGLGDRGLETLDHILTNHLIDLFEQCNEEGRRKDYRNRYRQSARSSTTAPAPQPQPQQQQQQQQQQQPTTQLRKQSSLRQRLATAQRDSGFVDDESYMEGGITPALTSDDGSSPGYVFVKPGEITQSSVSPPQHFSGYSPGIDDMMLPGATPAAVTMAGAAMTDGSMMTAGSFAADPCFSDYFIPQGHESGDLGLQYGSLGDYQPFGQGLGVYGGASGAEMPWMTPMVIGANEADLGAGQQDNTSAWVYGQPS
ncbi:hypothetical protein PpBr36_04147 [Pyricularia pennisetigena]|uniref:hypothetical protein n=1 Tax=Pyricularia pennisetigena TaxID=1578925 RepID=UPI00115369A0|nr:hypothetical protein PpBr36_04147 [Pyricularia pennisetigena]TLS26737.1 hypothetical protein PpBr36_04147 [Pyricularia pennisetigena]